MNTTATQMLRKYLGVREWLYFTKICKPPDDEFSEVRVDTVTNDVEYFKTCDTITGQGSWVRVVDGYMLEIDSSKPRVSIWINDLLEAFYG